MEIFIKEWIKNILVLIVFIITIELILPNGSIKKYVNLIIGILVIVVIISPFLNITDGFINIENEIVKTSAILDSDVLELKNNSLNYTKKQQIVRTYRQNLENYLKAKISKNYNVHVNHIKTNIVEDINDKNFGTIEKLYLNISFVNVDLEDNNEKIYVKVSANNSNNNLQLKKQKVNKIAEIKKDISHDYNLTNNNITIIDKD